MWTPVLPLTASVPWRWRIGIPAPLWIRNADIVQQFIKANKLSPISEQQLPFDFGSPVPMSLDPKSDDPVRIRPRPLPGGLRIAHLHFEGDIYPLNRKQWKDFSGRVLEQLRLSLENTEAVSFTQLMDLSETIDTL